MKRVNYYISEKQLESLKKESKKTGVSVSELIRRAIDVFLKKK